MFPCEIMKNKPNNYHTFQNTAELHSISCLAKPAAFIPRSYRESVFSDESEYFLPCLAGQVLYNPVNHDGVSGQVDMTVLVRSWKIILPFQGS
jgi:hypothetical protein